MALGNIYRYQLISNITENICIAGGWFLLLLNNSRPGKIILYCCTDQFHFLVRLIDMSSNLEEPQRKNQEPTSFEAILGNVENGVQGDHQNVDIILKASKGPKL